MVVTQKRQRWLVSLLLVLTIIVFLGFSFFPLLEGILPRWRSATSSSTPANNPNSDLAAQAKGYELVLQREPDNAAALRGLLDVRLQQGDLRGAITPLEKLSQVKSDEPDYAILLAQAQQHLGENEAAIQSFRKVLATQPGNMNALQGLAGLYLQQQRPLAAVGLLQDTIKEAEKNKSPGSKPVDLRSIKLLLGQVYASQKNYLEAIALYDNLIETDDRDFRPVLSKAMLLKEQGRVDQAKTLFEKATALAPAQYKDQIQELAKPKDSPEPAPTISPNLSQ